MKNKLLTDLKKIVSDHCENVGMINGKMLHKDLLDLIKEHEGSAYFCGGQDVKLIKYNPPKMHDDFDDNNERSLFEEWFYPKKELSEDLFKRNSTGYFDGYVQDAWESWQYRASIERYHDAYKGAREEVEIWKKRALEMEEMNRLIDPVAVHRNILFGKIPLSRDQALHIAGATDYDKIKQELSRIRTEIVGSLTDVGIFMLAAPDDPTSPGDISSAICRLASKHFGGFTEMVIPEGWQLVPKELTKEMIFSAVDVAIDYLDVGFDEIKEYYKAMLAAAPKFEQK